MSTPQVEAPPSLPSPQIQSAAPRKRRKRAPAAGAAADCFTCSTLNRNCDRRRPFCSQCLDGGKDCSGYKTQLTWGVGVASRGKLRGLSLPIAGSTQRASGPISPPKPKKRSSINERKTSVPAAYRISPNISNPHTLNCVETGRRPSFIFDQNGSLSGPPAMSNSTTWLPSKGLNVTSAPSMPIPIKSESYDTSVSAYNMQNVHYGSQDRFSHSTHSGSLSGFNLSEQASPVSYAESPQNVPYLGPSVQNPNFRSGPTDSRAYRIPDLLSPDSHATNTSSYQYQPASEPFFQTVIFEMHPGYDQSQEFSVHSNGVQHDEDIEDIGRGTIADEIAVIDDMSSSVSPFNIDFCFNIAPQFGSMSTIGKTPRMQYLINYYAEVISPVIVAFDGPSNPYRTHILRLAANSETLQHAIAALSASNLRQRRETGVISTGKTDPARRSSMAHLTLTDESFNKSAVLSPQDQAREETYHKGFAIQSLNAQLADPVLRKEDSILATLLVLCLFHICDSGVAKFQTQFAGVKKLLSLRGSDLGIDSKEAKWFTRMFTWFDAMTATVNDREGQLLGRHLDVTALSDEEWALENLAGCDGHLFKIIANLGRLNVLRQGQSVGKTPTLVSRPLPIPSLPFATAINYSNFDGNGWSRIIADEDLFTAKTAIPDPQEQFWREWRETRQALQMWQLDTTLFDSTSSEAPLLSVEQRLDLANISESFRYSALLYTERLASPSADSDDANIRALVRQSLSYIKLVKSDVYLLWPLFITGSECVDDDDIAVIRERCVDIQRDSGFFNNQSCLELLEKVWEKRHLGRREVKEKGFRFTEVMRAEGNEGEYIVV